MATVQLEGKNLGERHKYLNKLVKEAITNSNLLGPDEPDSDIKTLINIDVANEKRDVDYIIKILSCSDMLYVSRAIKKCDWLITDEQYAHIINPEYLNSNIYPHMQTKAVIKLKTHIRLKLKNEKRVEQFYTFEQNPSDALRWLPNCSITFIENNFGKHVDKIDISTLKRLCEKSMKCLEIYAKSDNYSKSDGFKTTLFLLHVDVNKFLDIVESQPKYFYPSFGKRATKILMTKCPERILNKFGDYCRRIDTPTFVKYVKKQNVKEFLLKEAMDAVKVPEDICVYFSGAKNWKTFINALPKAERFEFVKQVFLDEIQNKDNIATDLEKAINMLRDLHTPTPIYQWYQFAPFEEAFTSIKAMIGPETDACDKREMLKTLLVTAEGNLEHGKIVLKYFRDKQINSNLESKRQFLNDFISKFNTHTFDENTWNIFQDIINTMDIYSESESNNSIIEAMLLYKILHNENIPDEIQKTLEFNTLSACQRKLKLTEREIVFSYVYTLIWNKLETVKLTCITELEQYVGLLVRLLTVLKEWEKNLTDYPLVLEKIKLVVNIKQEMFCTINMSPLYNLQKSWRKYMFEQSFFMCPSEEVLLNSIKHGPNLLELHKHEVESMFFKDNISLKRLLRKVRIYWPKSLSAEWKLLYLKRLNQSEDHNAVTKGLCFLMPQSELEDILKKHAPKDPKIDWSKIQEVELSLQRCFAKNMHIARPQPTVETILLYAKGDYLQYSLPSLLAIYYNLSCAQSVQLVPKLLDVPVSLQKHGIRYVCTKLPTDKLKEYFNVLWKNNKNSTIRFEIFKITFHVLCNEKNDRKIKDTWALLELFIDNLSLRENKEIYKLLYKIEHVPQCIKANFLVKSYKFLKTLTMEYKNDYVGYEWDIKRLAQYCRKIMESMPSNFVADIILEFTNNEFFKEKLYENNMTQLLSSYLLCAKDESTQIKKYDEVLYPILRRSFELWNDLKNGEYYVKINFEQLIYDFITDLKYYVAEYNMNIPVKMFSMILTEMERSLLISENYILIRSWRLVTELVNLLVKNKPIDWEQTCFNIAPEFGKICVDILKEDTKSYFSCIYVLFTRALGVLKNILPERVQYVIYNYFIQNEDFVQGYLVAVKLLKIIDNDEMSEKVKDFREKIRNHPSAEVKMHYYDVFQEDRRSLLSV